MVSVCWHGRSGGSYFIPSFACVCLCLLHIISPKLLLDFTLLGTQVCLAWDCHETQWGCDLTGMQKSLTASVEVYRSVPLAFSSTWYLHFTLITVSPALGLNSHSSIYIYWKKSRICLHHTQNVQQARMQVRPKNVETVQIFLLAHFIWLYQYLCSWSPFFFYFKILAPRGTAILVWSLSMKNMKKVGSWCNRHCCHTCWVCSWCHRHFTVQGIDDVPVYCGCADVFCW